jgi:hypothetical protein
VSSRTSRSPGDKEAIPDVTGPRRSFQNLVRGLPSLSACASWRRVLDLPAHAGPVSIGTEMVAEEAIKVMVRP